jgi:hypothetical protein
LPSSEDPLVADDFDNYRSNSWHSSQIQLNPSAVGTRGSEIKTPLLQNPYTTYKDKKKKSTKKEDQSRKSLGPKKKKLTKEELETAEEAIKLSDIQASKTLKIDDLRRTDVINPTSFPSYQREAYFESLRKASDDFNAENFRSKAFSFM